MLDSKEKNGCVCYVFLMILVTVDALLEVGVVYRCHRAAISEQSLNSPIFASRKSLLGPPDEKTDNTWLIVNISFVDDFCLEQFFL